ncbi:glycoside hydrolase superfamily [Lipomyces oligophaga]|uniref:glycoside hydrolase superfamily n=1 Tax=Lipomyces oligophaga TaxID=45792 RepID=UPI0034CD8600
MLFAQHLVAIAGFAAMAPAVAAFDFSLPFFGSFAAKSRAATNLVHHHRHLPRAFGNSTQAPYPYTNSSSPPYPFSNSSSAAYSFPTASYSNITHPPFLNISTSLPNATFTSPPNATYTDDDEYTSTVYQIVYVTVDPEPEQSTSSGTDLGYASPTLEIDLVTRVMTLTSTVTRLSTYTSLSVSDDVTSTIELTATLTSTQYIPSTTVETSTVDSGPTTTYTVFSTFVIYESVPAVETTEYTSVTTPGTYTFGDLTTTITATGTVIVPCSTGYSVPDASTTDGGAVVISYVPLSSSSTSMSATATSSYAVQTDDSAFDLDTSSESGSLTETVDTTSTYTVYASTTPASNGTYVPASESSPAAKKLLRRRIEVPQIQFGVPASELFGITYSPYTSSGECKPITEITSNLVDISTRGFKTVRLYSPDCSSLEAATAVWESLGLKVILGISLTEAYSTPAGKASADIQIHALEQFENWDAVEMVVVGNEAVFNEQISISDLVALIGKVRNVLRSSGYLGPVTTAETPSTLAKNAELICSSVDVLGVNAHPFFDASITPSNAGYFVRTVINQADGLCNHEKNVVILETGWPSAGEGSNGNAVPGPEQQAEAISSIRTETEGLNDVVYFTFADDDWKLPGAFGVEQRFGAAHLF